MKPKLEADFAMSTGRTFDCRAGQEGWNWTGWQRRRWPANIDWVGRRVYAFDLRKEHRRFCALLEITHGGAFPYWTKRDFIRGVESLCKWRFADDPHLQRITFVSRAHEPCVGFTARWRVVKRVNIPYAIDPFPQIGWAHLSPGTPLEEVGVDTADLFEEGRRVLRAHQVFERNPRLRAEAREYWRLEMKGKLSCRVCGFSFERHYGELGRDFIEMHHEEWLSLSKGPKKHGVTDLVPVCSNCHRMLHRRRDDELSVAQLKARLKKKK